MYTVTCDNNTIHNPAYNLSLVTAKLSLQDNAAGSFEFTIDRSNPQYSNISLMSSIIEVFQNNERLFRGTAKAENIDIFGNKIITCEGDLAFLDDSIMRPFYSPSISVSGAVNMLVSYHNSNVTSGDTDRKYFRVGTIASSLVSKLIPLEINYESTLSVIKRIRKDLGGYIRVRYDYDSNVGKYYNFIDWLNEDPGGGIEQNTQLVQFGDNLLDFNRNIDFEGIATVLIPLGAKSDTPGPSGMEVRINISSVNDNKITLESANVDTYGKIERVEIWDDCTSASQLKTLGQAWLDSEQFGELVLDVDAFDLNLSSAQFERLKLLTAVRVVSQPHGLDRYFLITKLSYDLINPAKNRITLGNQKQLSLSTKTANLQADFERSRL